MFTGTSGMRVRMSLALLLAFGVSACGGGGGGTSPLPAAPASGNNGQTTSPFTLVSQNGTSIELTGTITGMISGGFTVEGGKGVGYLHIYVNASTVITGPAPYVGENVDVKGTGTPSTSVTASSVTQLASSTPTPAPSATPTPVGTVPPPASTPTPAAPGAPIALPSGVITVTGQIGTISGNKIQLQAGAGCGWMNVYTTSSTVDLDGRPQTGQYAVVTGTGTRCLSMTAASTISVSSSPFSTGNFAGTVTAATPYGFTLSTGGSNVNVALSSATVVFGATLSVNSNVTVTAYGTVATGLTATQIAVQAPPTPTPNPSVTPSPTPAPISTVRVKTFAYLYGYAGTATSVTPAQAAPWIDWTQTDEAHESVVRAAGIKAQVYTNFWRNYSTDNPNVGYVDLKPGGAHASAEALDCSSNPVIDSNYGGGYLADPRTSAASAHAQLVVNYRTGEYQNAYDAVFADDTGTIEGPSTQPCNYVQSTWDQATNTVIASLGTPVFINALGQQNPVQATDMLQPSNVLGAMCELCYSRNGGPNGDFVQTGSNWTNVENAEIATVNMHKIFWDYGRASGSASSETGLRVYTYASFLLTYDPNYTMFQEALATPSGFPVFPEVGFVPMNPLTTQSSVSGYQGPGGVYFREFADCYYQGQFVNSCAVAVNPNSSSAPVPSTSYQHSMVLSGAGVLDGGSVSFNGGPVSTLAPGTAAILLP